LKTSEAPYAWVVVGACFVALGVIFGVAYSFAAFFESFAHEFAAQRADVALVFGLTGLVYFGLGAVGGILSDRLGPRLVCSAGMVCIAAGLWAASRATSLMGVYWSYGVGVGLGVALVYTPAIGCVQPWFTARRGLAAGIASAGIGLGTLATPLLVAVAVQAWQWRAAMAGLAWGSLVLGLSATLLLRRAPLAPGDAAGPATGLSLSQALRDRRFWWFYGMCVAAAPTMFVPFAHVSASARDGGVLSAQAVGLVGLIGIGSLIGRFTITALADRLGRVRTILVMQVSMGLAIFGWMLATHVGDVYLLYAVFAIWHGLSYGAIVSLMPAVCMDLFGARAVAGIIGTLYTGAAFGNLLGPVLAGAAYDRTGSYAPVMWACALLSALATASCMPIARTHRPETP
jgi:MFS family permease